MGRLSLRSDQDHVLSVPSREDLLDTLRGVGLEGARRTGWSWRPQPEWAGHVEPEPEHQPELTVRLP